MCQWSRMASAHRAAGSKTSLTNKAVPASIAPKTGGGGADDYVAIDANNRTDVAIPLGVGHGANTSSRGNGASCRRFGRYSSELRCRTVWRWRDVGRVIGFDLGDQMNAGGGGLLECFF